MNFFDLLPWWTWLVGSIGIVGIIILMVAAPAMAALIWDRLSKALYAAIRTPLGAALVFGAVGLGIGWVLSGNYAKRQCNDAIAALRVKSLNAAISRDAEIKADVENKFAAIVAELEKEAADRDRKVKNYEQKLSASTAKCELGDEPLRLRKGGR